MAESRSSFVLVVAAGSNPASIGDAVTAFVKGDRGSISELHVLAQAPAGEGLRNQLLRPGPASDALTKVWTVLGLRRSDIIFGARTVHALGSAEPTTSIGAVADDALEAVRRLCADDNQVAIVVSADAGPLALLAHAALQLVGKPRDRFFFMEYQSAPHADRGSQSDLRNAHRPPARRRVKRPVLLELPTVLAEHPLALHETFQKTAASRRLARRRLAEPDTLVFISRRRTIRIEDTEVVLPRLQFFWLFALATIAPHAFPLKALSGNFTINSHGQIVVAPHHHDRASLDAVVAHIRKIFSTLFPDALEEFSGIFKRACGPSPGLPSVIGKINTKLRGILGVGATPYLVAGGRGGEGYRMALPAERISFDVRVAAAHPTKQ